MVAGQRLKKKIWAGPKFVCGLGTLFYNYGYFTTLGIVQPPREVGEISRSVLAATEFSTSPAPSLGATLLYGIEITRGNILWLKPKSACCVTTPFAYIDMEDRCFDNPVLILLPDPQQATATILLVRKASKSL